MTSALESLGGTISCSINSLSPVASSSTTTVTGDLGQTPSQTGNGECTSASSSAFFSEHEPCACELCVNPRPATCTAEPSQSSPFPPTADDRDLGESEEVDDARRLQASLECYMNGSLSDTDSLLDQLEQLERHLRKNRQLDDKSSTRSESPRPSLIIPSPSSDASPSIGQELPRADVTSHTHADHTHESNHSRQASQSSALSESVSCSSLKPPQLIKRSSSALSSQNPQSTTSLCLLERPPYVKLGECDLFIDLIDINCTILCGHLVMRKSAVRPTNDHML